MSAGRLRVAVIGGGDNAEHEVSLASAAAVRTHLFPAHEVVALTIRRGGGWCDGDGHGIDTEIAIKMLVGCDVVFPAIHGEGGEDGTIAALCRLLELPCVGSPAAAGATAMDKHLTKLVAAAAGIQTAAGTLLTGASSYGWTGPVVVKPARAGSSRGVSLVQRPEDLEDALVEAFAYDDRVLVEEVLHGREIDVAVLGTADGERHVPPVLEIVGPGVFDYDTKYGGGADLRVPAAVTPDERESLTDAALRVYDALGCRGLARIDFFLTDEGPVLLEVNTMPGMTQHSQAPRMFAAAGMPYPVLLDLMVREAMARRAGTIIP